MPRKRRLTYDYIMPLFYFKCDSSPLKISPQITVRKIDQMELFGLEEDLPSILNELEMQTIFHALETVAKSEKLLDETHARALMDETYELFQQVITALRLLKAGPLYTKVIFMVRPDSTVRAKWTYKGIPPHPDYYVLHKDELRQLNKILESLKHFYISKDGNKSPAVALKFFEKSYEDDLQTAIVSCWTAFEALCFGGEKAGEGAIGSTVRIAISMLLGKSRKEREHIRSFLSKAYKARCDIVHGKERKSKDDMFMVKKLQDYLRRSIVKLLS